jgi:methionine-rich copper-binding protein CopC
MAGLVLAALASFGAPLNALAHAEPERTSPPMNGVVETAPAKVEIWFSEEAKSDGTIIQVIGPGGIQVDLGDSALDLNDPERKHVTVSLRSGLGPGAYTVQWHSVSGEDGDEAQGGYLFTVAGGSPVASPVALPAGTPVNAAQSTAPTATATIAGTPTTAPAATEGDFDSRAFGLSVLAGLVAAAAIFIFWRIVRPKNPKFRG